MRPLALLLLLGGCVMSPTPEQIEAARVTGLEPRQIAPGNSKDYVRLQWGEPYAVSTSAYNDGVLEVWSYCWPDYRLTTCDQAVRFVDDHVYAIDQYSPAVPYVALLP